MPSGAASEAIGPLMRLSSPNEKPDARNSVANSTATPLAASSRVKSSRKALLTAKPTSAMARRPNRSDAAGSPH